MKVKILIPIYNDWNSVNRLVDNIDKVINDIDCDFSIIIVNDASTQKKPENSFNFKNLKSIKIINMLENRGHARCNAAGLKYIYENEDFDYVLPMDGDGEDRPEEIIQFVEKIKTDPETPVVGERIKRSESNLFKFCYVIHKVLNDITVDDWSIVIGGDSHTRMSKGVAFGADSGTVALALATGEATMPIPESVKVTFRGKMADHMDFRDVVHATQAQMLQQHNENVFQGRIIEVHIGTLLSDQAFTFTDWTAEMKAKAAICISQDKTLIESLNIAKDRIRIMIEKGMDNENNMLEKFYRNAPIGITVEGSNTLTKNLIIFGLLNK